MEISPPPAEQPLSAEEEAFMRAFARALTVMPQLFDADLQHDQRLSLNEYMVLRSLSEANDRHLSMSDLANSCAISLSGMTRIIDRLAEPGWVKRERSVLDGRSWNAVLTDAGLDRLRTAWPTHLRSVRRRVFAHTTGIDLRDITEALRNFVR